MTRVFILDPKRHRAATVGAELTRAGLQVHTIESGLEAITALERAEPDLVLCREHLGDMAASELCAAIESDTAVETPEMVLLLDRDSSLPEADLRYCLLIEPQQPIRQVLLTYLGRPPLAVPTRPQRGLPTFCFVGTGGPEYVADLVQLVATRESLGALTVICGSRVAQLFFERGFVRHATYRGIVGEAAFARLFADLVSSGARFSFESASEAELEAQPCTIGVSALHLLIHVAVSYDEKRQPQEVAAERLAMGRVQ